MQQQAESDASVTYQAPSLVFTDCWRATFVEADAFTGGATRTYRFNLHPSIGWTTGAYSWRTPAPVNYAQAQGLAIAADAGYYDQARLIAEFRAIAGTTPRELIRELRAADA